MSDTAASSFVRQELVPERVAPVKVTGFVGFLRARLFNSPTNILLTLASVLLLWITDHSGRQISSGRCRLERKGPHRLSRRKCRTFRRRLLAVCPGKIHSVHLRLLSRSRSVGGSI